MYSIGSRSIRRQVLQTLTFSVVLLVVTLVFFAIAKPEDVLTRGWWAFVVPVLLPAIIIPIVRKTNTWAVVDPRTWLISINGGPFRPLAEIRYAQASIQRGVCVLKLGFTDKDAFVVQANTPWFTKKSEREFVKYLLPYTGVPRTDAEVPETGGGFWGSTRGVSLPRAIAFSNDHL